MRKWKCEVRGYWYQWDALYIGEIKESESINDNNITMYELYYEVNYEGAKKQLSDYFVFKNLASAKRFFKSEIRAKERCKWKIV